MPCSMYCPEQLDPPFDQNSCMETKKDLDKNEAINYKAASESVEEKKSVETMQEMVNE